MAVRFAKLRRTVTMTRKTRRRFLQTVAGASAGALVVGSEASAQDPPARGDEVARHLAEVVRLRFGPQLNEQQLRIVQQRISRSLANAETLRRTPLENGDEPAFVFVPQDDV
jgi:hypothetical protein